MMIVIGSEDDDNGGGDDDVADGDHDGGKVGVWVENGLMTGVAATLVSCSFPPFPSSHHQHTIALGLTRTNTNTFTITFISPNIFTFTFPDDYGDANKILIVLQSNNC